MSCYAVAHKHNSYATYKDVYIHKYIHITRAKIIT